MASVGSNRNKSRSVWHATLLTAALVLAGSTTANAVTGFDDGVDPVGDYDQSDDSAYRADGMRFVPNMLRAFDGLTERPESLGLNFTSTPHPSLCHHYQAITRVDGPDGTPYLFVTKNGNYPELSGLGLPDAVACDLLAGGLNEKHNGSLIIFKMGSRNKTGERLRSNRLEKGVHVNSTPPSAADEASIFYTVTEGALVQRDGPEGSSGVPAHGYSHPGGMQVVGHILALAADTPRGSSSSPSQVQFFDVSDPESPKLLSRFEPTNEAGQPLHDADGIGVTPLANGRYLLSVITGFPGKLVPQGDPFDPRTQYIYVHAPVYFYRSKQENSVGVPNVLASTGLTWEYVGKGDEPKNGPGDAHQSFQLLRERDINGNLYLAGARGYYAGDSEDHDRIDLYHVRCYSGDLTFGVLDVNCPPGSRIEISPEPNGAHGRVLTPFPNTGGAEQADFAAASGFHVTPTGELLFYATRHNAADSPGRSVNMGEWHHVNMVRDGSPTYLPTATVRTDFYEVDEGGLVELTGSATPPITKPWVELFLWDDFGGVDFSSLYVTVDYEDYLLDDFDDFFTLERGDITHGNRTRSLKWFAPKSCKLRVFDDGAATRRYVSLTSDGNVHSIQILGTDLYTVIDGVDFESLSSCDAYYANGFDLTWDLDLNGTFERTGNSVLFDAAAFDGPSQLGVPARAQDREGGKAGQRKFASVRVRNVAPKIESALLLDPYGRVFGTDVPAGLPITFNATFKDQGRLDTQTATVNWGDGSVQTQFDLFSDAHGGVLGKLAHNHKYAAGTYTLVLTVKDDDGGTSTFSRPVIAKTADLALTMKAPADLVVKIGGEGKLSYAITVTNVGPGAAGAIAVSDTLPSGTQFVSASVAGGVCQGPPVGSGGTVTCSIQAMPSGTSAVMTLVIKVKRTLLSGAKVVNKATVSSGSTDPKLTNNAASAQTKFVGALLK